MPEDSDRLRAGCFASEALAATEAVSRSHPNAMALERTLTRRPSLKVVR